MAYRRGGNGRNQGSPGLWLWLAGVGKKRVARQLGLDPKTVRRYVRAAQSSGLSPPCRPEALTDERLTPSCSPCGPLPSGPAANAVNRTALDLSWGLSCSPGATDYAVMEGTLGSWSSHVPLVCSTGGATSTTVSPGSGASHYYLVVPLSATEEGSYGIDSTGAERPPSATRCRQVQNTAGCP